MSDPTPLASVLPDTYTPPAEQSCVDCGATFTVPTLLVTGHAFRLGVRCPRCTERRDEQEAADALARRRARSERHLLDIARQHDEARAQALDALAVPPLYADVSFDTYELHGSAADRAAQTAALAFARRYAEAFPVVSPLVLFGSTTPGTGKGHLAWSIAKHVAGDMGRSARVVKLADMVRHLRASWRQRDAESEDRALGCYRGPMLLVVDEVSRHAFYGEPRQHLYDVLDYRLEHLRPTILTSNEDDAGVAEVLGPALISRLEGAGGILDFGAASWRSRPREVA